MHDVQIPCSRKLSRREDHGVERESDLHHERILDPDEEPHAVEPPRIDLQRGGIECGRVDAVDRVQVWAIQLDLPGW